MRVFLHFVLSATLMSGSASITQAQEPQTSLVPSSPFKGDPAFHTSQEIHAHGKMPRLLHTVDPSFTDEARQMKINGQVFVSLVVDEHGLPTRLSVLRGLGHGLDEKALEAVNKYRFKPGMYDGHAVSVPLIIAVNFQIF